MAQKAHDEVLQAKQQLQEMQQSAAEKFELLTKQTLFQSMEQQKKIDKVCGMMQLFTFGVNLCSSDPEGG